MNLANKKFSKMGDKKEQKFEVQFNYSLEIFH